MSNILEQARIIRAEMDSQNDKLQKIRNLIDSLKSTPTLADFKTFLTELKELVKEG